MDATDSLLPQRGDADSTLTGSGGAAGGSHPSRWIGWRLRMLVGAALFGCIGVFMLARWLAEPLQVDARWRPDAEGRLQLVATGEPALRSAVGQALQSIDSGAPGGQVRLDDAGLLQRSPRWLVDDAQRERQSHINERLARALGPLADGAQVTLSFADGHRSSVPLKPRGFSGLGAMFWLLAALALTLCGVMLAVLLAKPSARNLLYAVMSLCQTASLLCIAIESVPSLGLPPAFARVEPGWRVAFDLVTAAAIVHSTAVHPLRLPGWRSTIGAAWFGVGALLLAAQQGRLDHLWWWTQGSVLALGTVAIGLLAWSHRLEPHPFALVLQRFGIITIGSWGLITFVMATATPELQYHVASTGTVIWYVFLASLLLMVPFLSKSQQLLREFSLLALTSTLATTLDLMFAALFSFGQFASLTLSLFLALGIYTGARQWMLTRLRGTSMMTTERMFEQLYRIAREVEVHPERTAALLTGLLKDLFEPIEASVVAKATSVARVLSDGSTLQLPVPGLGGPDADAPAASILLRFAQRGRRLFTSDDARLADRIVEQLCRAVAFDRAVEQGRREERLRLAQDLHDDIGARLLTLMYKSPSPEMEDYVRHTLQDLKTLTRGLAAANHRLSHAAGEWKADLSQRLTAAHILLVWRFEHDEDLLLSVVQWSGLTRVLRELVSNVIAHAQAQRVVVAFALIGDALELTVQDDGLGADPKAWSHGLGIGGIRKRVKQLGGEVDWRCTSPRGIRCRVTIREFSSRV